MGLDQQAVFEDLLIQKLKDTIEASKHLAKAIQQKLPTQGSTGCWELFKNRARDAHTDMMYNPELAQSKQAILEGLVRQVEHIKTFHLNEYKEIFPIKDASPVLYERLNMNLEISRIREVQRYVKDAQGKINGISYEQLRSGGSSQQSLEALQKMIEAYTETRVLDAIRRQLHTNGTLAYCYDSARKTAAEMFGEYIRSVIATPHGQIPTMAQYDPRAQFNDAAPPPPSYDPFAMKSSSVPALN